MEKIDVNIRSDTMSYLYSLYSALARKWEFEQMGVLAKNSLLTIREKMGIRAKGNFDSQTVKILRKWKGFGNKLVKINDRVFEIKTLEFRGMRVEKSELVTLWFKIYSYFIANVLYVHRQNYSSS